MRSRNIMTNGGDHINYSWSVSGTFSSSYPSDSSSNLYSAQHGYPKYVDKGINQDHPRSQFPTQQDHQQSNNFMPSTILPIVVVVAFMLCLCMGGRNTPGEEFHRGHLIREQARRIRETQERKAKRQDATPEERLAAIRSGLCAFRVLRKDSSTGRCELGESEIELPSREEEKIEARIESKKSTDTADTLPLDLDNKSDSGGSCNKEATKSDNEEGEDDVCPVCLDGFGIGDTVMFARSLSCNHVFHEECLLPWLLERRENECPSCRAVLVQDDDEENKSKHENESNRDDSNGGNNIICDLSTDGSGENRAREEGVVDLESGMVEATADELDITTYFIDMGRIVAISRNETETENERETAKDRISFLGQTTGTDATTARISDLSQVPQLLPRFRALSVSSMEGAPLFCHELFTRDENESYLSIPLPLCRVSQSLPINPRRKSQPTMLVALCGNMRIDVTAPSCPNLQIYQDDRYLKLLPLHMHDSFYDSSSGGDESDEDDAIRRMIENHHLRSDTPNSVDSSALPSNISSIFVKSQR